MKEILYYATTKKDIEAFPRKAKERIAQLLEMLSEEMDLQPQDFSYMATVGMGVYELRVKADKNYRVFYVAKFEESIYVLHAFSKKTQKTEKKDLEKGRERYKALLHFREVKK